MGSFLVACDQNTGTETPIGVPEEERGLVQEGGEVQNASTTTYDDTRNWVTTNTARADEVTEDEFKRMRSEYQRREAELDQQKVNWDDDTREKWERTKQEWSGFENSVQQRLGNIDVDADIDVQRENN
ncbi:hypothetical protein GCM10007389_27710 [Pontibacter akesuensis]|nr:hypothetical protein GCM10007389_27710 [Pontibacter akesuensis]